MITLSNPDKSLEELRDYANTKTQVLIEPGMSAEVFTNRVRKNIQVAYDWATDKMSGTILGTLSLEDLSKIHRTLCRDLQGGGGKYDPDAALRYESSRDQLVADLEKTNSSEARITAIANHTARCEDIRLFPDHNSTVMRIALEVYQDNELGRANRPAIPQGAYLDAVEKAQRGDPKDLCYLIKSNHEKAVEAGKDLWSNQQQTVRGDYTTDVNAQDASSSPNQGQSH